MTKIAIKRNFSFSRVFMFLILLTGSNYILSLNFAGISIKAFEGVLIVWFALFLSKIKIRITVVEIALFLLILLSWLSTIIHSNMSSVENVFRIGIVIMLLIYFSNNLYSASEVKSVYHMYIMIGVMYVLIGIINWLLYKIGLAQFDSLLYRSMSGIRIQSVLPDPNRFGNYAAIVFSASLIYTYVSKIKIRKCLIVLISFIGLILSGSRGALFASLMSVLLIVAMTRKKLSRKNRFKIWLAIVLFIPIIIFVMNITDVNIIDRILGTSVNQHDTIFNNIRLTFFRLSIESILSSPKNFVFGTGGIVDVNNPTSISPHNTYLKILIDFGIVGLIVFLTIIANFLSIGCKNIKGWLRNSEHEKIAMTAGMFTMFLHFNTIVLDFTGFAWIFLSIYYYSVRN